MNVFFLMLMIFLRDNMEIDDAIAEDLDNIEETIYAKLLLYVKLVQQWFFMDHELYDISPLEEEQSILFRSCSTCALMTLMKCLGER